MAIKFCKDVDEILGNKASRYFGNGYKNVHYDILNLLVENDAITAVTTIHYPLAWSKKDTETDLVPHLSTIDATYIGLQLSEVFLTLQFDLDTLARNQLFIKTLHLKAKQGVLEDLNKVVCKVIHFVVSGTSYDCHQFRGQIGNIEFYSEIEMRTYPSTNLLSKSFETVSEILGNPKERYFGILYKQTQHSITNIETDGDLLVSKAEIVVKNEIFDSNNHQGLDTAHLSNLTPSVLDCIVAIAQLSQVLIYEMDDVNRKNSNTLWMRKVKIDRKRVTQPIFQPSSIKVEKTKVVKMRQEKWRMVDLEGAFYNYNFQYSLAHILPEGDEGI